MKLNNKLIIIPFLASVVFFALGSCSTNIEEKESGGIIFPQPFAFAIDDLGWNVGNDDGDVNGQGPYRIGIDRKMDIDDYKCIVNVAKEVGVRVQALFILGEMDRKNILGRNPTMTWMGADWDNTKNISQEQIDIMNFVQENAAYLEFGLHGVGHEYWVDKVKKRAEWYCTEDNHPWPEETIRQHIQSFKDIMAQYGLSDANGHSFPESFVPCAYSFHWNPNGDYSTGSLLTEAGVKYANTQFNYIEELNPPKGANEGGYDHGVLVLNRFNYGNEWYKLDALPTVELEKQESNIIESHWSNWLAQDKFLQEKVNSRWVDYYRSVQENKYRYIAKNTEQFYSQWLYNKYTTVKERSPGTVYINNLEMPAEPYTYESLGNMVLKVKLDSTQHVSKATINGKQISCYFEEQGYGYIYLPKLKQDIYELNYEIGSESLSSYINNNGTYNVYAFNSDNKGLTAQIRLYGEQTIEFCGVKKPNKITLSNSNVQIVSQQFDPKRNDLKLTLKGVDIQGETSEISVLY